MDRASQQDRQRSDFEWLQDCALKGADGLPLVLFHGTSAAPFDVVDLTKSREDEPVFFVTSDPKMASDFALYRTVWNGANVMPFHVQADSVLEIDGDRRSIRDVENGTRLQGMHEAETLRSFARRKGHDAILIKNTRDGAGPEIAPVANVYLLFDTAIVRNRFTLKPESEPSMVSKNDTRSELAAWAGTQGLRNASGDLQVFFHGSKTPQHLNEFVPGGSEGSIQSGDAYGTASYFTSNPREASAHARDEGAVFPVYLRGNILDLDQPLTTEQSQRLTAFAEKHLLPSDKARFECGRAERSFERVEDARDFFENQRQNWVVFGDGMDRARPEAIAKGSAFVIEYTDFDAPISIRTGRDAETLFKAIGWDNVRAAGFDGVRMQRGDGSDWVVMHNTLETIRFSLSNQVPNDRKALALAARAYLEEAVDNHRPALRF